MEGKGKMSNVDYNKAVLDHFQNPRNMGEMENPDADYPSFETVGLFDYGTFKGIPNKITTGEYYHKNKIT